MTQYFVYPGHGVGKLLEIESKEVFGSINQFYRIEILDSKMIVLVPVKTADSVGLRPIMSKITAQQCRNILKTVGKPVQQRGWQQQYREYMETIKSGEPLRLAQAVAELQTHEIEKGGLSFGERNMLQTALKMLTREIGLAGA